MIIPNPTAVPHNLKGLTEGTLTVDSFAYRDGKDFKFNIRCERCGDSWIETHRRIADGFLRQGCRNNLCRLNRLPERKLSAHERWLDSPEPVAVPQQPEPPKTEPVQRAEQVSADYLRYVAACQKTGTASVPWREFDSLGPILHKNVMLRVSAIEEKE